MEPDQNNRGSGTSDRRGGVRRNAMATNEIERIRNANDIVALISEQVELKKSGGNYLARCPFHADRTPSLVVSPTKQLFHCFGCGAGGDLFAFLMRRDGLSFLEAAERLAIRAGIAFEKRGARKPSPPLGEMERFYALNAAAAAHFQNNLQEPQGANARAYLRSRGITDEAVRTFGIGYAPPKGDALLREIGAKFPSDELLAAGLVAHNKEASSGTRLYHRFRNRILFPIRSQAGKVVGFGGRSLDDTSPKYLNTPETAIFSKGRHLFGLDLAVRPMPGGKRGPLVIMEGYFDAVVAHQAGFTRTVATMGTALTSEQVALIRRLTDEVILALDPDEAGVQATYRATLLLLSQGMPTRVAVLPAGEDPDRFIRRAGPDAFSERLATAATPIDYFTVRWADPSAPIEKRVAVAREIFVLIRQMKSRIAQGDALQKWAAAANLSESDLRAEFFHTQGKRAIPISQAKPRSLSASFPKDEALILSGLLMRQLDPATLNGRLHPDDFTHPEVRKMIEPFWGEGRWRRNDPAPCPDPVTGQATDEMAQEMQDAIASLRARRIDRESAGLTTEIKRCEADGRQSEAAALQARLAAIRKERCTVSTVHASRMAAPHR